MNRDEQQSQAESEFSLDPIPVEGAPGEVLIDGVQIAEDRIPREKLAQASEHDEKVHQDRRFMGHPWVSSRSSTSRSGSASLI